MGKRRANGDGCLYQRKDGRWVYKFMIGWQDNGNPKIKHFYGKTQYEAKEKAAAWKRNLFDGINTELVYGFSEWADIWFAIHKRQICAATQQGYLNMLRRLKSYFGNNKIIDFKAIHIEMFLQDMIDQGYSYATVHGYRGILYQIFNKAEANDLIRKNPVRYAEHLRSEKTPVRKEAFNKWEVSQLMNLLPYDRTGISIRLMLGTGIRTQELLALEPKHISPDGTMLYIRQAVTMVKGTVFVGTPKSRDSYRDVPVPPSLYVCAMMLRNTEKKFIWEEGRTDCPCNPSYFRREFRNAVEKVEGVRVLTPHCCRHTYVSQMQALGVDIETIKSIVGHADIDMTEHYLHVQDSIRNDAVQRFSSEFPMGILRLSDGEQKDQNNPD